MNILMLTNTFTPHVGGVARSVEAFTAEYRKAGHRVIVVAPEFEGVPDGEVDVIRIPALQKFNGSDFSVRLPIPGLLTTQLGDFRPDLIHSHHPFLLGYTAVRLASQYDVPLVFTHHTMYEQYTHYVPGDSQTMIRFVKSLATGYANLCDQVFAPSQSVAAVLRQRGVTSAIETIPTGVDVARFSSGDGAAFRRDCGIPNDAFVVGHVGRLAPEKNLGFLADAVARFVRGNPASHFLVVGSGPSEQEILRRFEQLGLGGRLHLAGSRSGQELVDAYHAMDVFAFASQSETQGMVLTEAMAAGVPVVAVDAPGAREVVVDGRNGRLLRRQNRRRFVAALASIAKASPAQREALCREAVKTAESFSMPACAAKALRIYEALVQSKPREKETEDSVWEAALRRIESEWELLSNLATSATTALQAPSLWRIPGLGYLIRGWRRMRRWVNRGEWGIRLLRLSVSEDTATEPGLILVQIDGLAQTQFERALASRRMPFLRRLMRKEGYELHGFYSGLPSSTPAVQGEIFYGVKTAVPAFAFRDLESGELVKMYQAEPAAEVEKQLAAQGQGLMEGGSVYGDIYTGGAAEAHFCSPVMGWGNLLRNANPLSLLVFTVWHVMSVLRIVALMGLEFILALVDFSRGVWRGRDFRAESKFLLSRVGVSIALREFVTIGASIDAARGLPVIHVNFLGYDEQSHRRGPGSRFAHWSLKGIDGCIKRIWQAARRSRRRDYQVWVYADHGQEHTLPYSRLTGRTIEDAVREAFQTPVADERRSEKFNEQGGEVQRSAWLGGKWMPRLFGETPRAPSHAIGELQVAAMGPVGLIYAPGELSADKRRELAERLVCDAQVPAVYAFDADGELWAYTPDGRLRFPDEAAEVLGEDHPFLEEAARDLVDLCRHPCAGQLVLSGYRRGAAPVSFALENGAHAGPGAEETRGFALLPPGISLPPTEKAYLRPGDLRAAALHNLGRAPLRTGRRISRPRTTGVVRVMTYNVHSCIGMDGHVSTARIARLIAQYAPDIVCLQEVDVRCERTGGIDQAHRIARELEMEFHFYPTISLEEENYGNAVLTPHPLRVIRAGRLPGLPERPDLEPRGAIWVEVEVGDQTVQVLNTHLGLLRKERLTQAKALLGPQWLGGPDRREPVILCGDLNALPRSHAYRRLAAEFKDAQRSMVAHRPRGTWLSRYPFTRIDHVLIGRGIEVVRVEVPRTALARKASDHLPLIVDLRIPEKSQLEQRVWSPDAASMGRSPRTEHAQDAQHDQGADKSAEKASRSELVPGLTEQHGS